jgi:hypothetical protein
MNFCFFFNAIGQKVLNEEALESLEERHYETLCFIEMYFPTAFFDISIHFTTHRIKEIKLLGPVFLHLPEGSMVQRYYIEKDVECALNYADPSNQIGFSKSHHEGRLTGKGTIGKKAITPDPNLLHYAHFHVLRQMSIVSEYFDENKEVLLRDNPGHSESWLENEHKRKFTAWLRDMISQ